MASLFRELYRSLLPPVVGFRLGELTLFNGFVPIDLGHQLAARRHFRHGRHFEIVGKKLRGKPAHALGTGHLPLETAARASFLFVPSADGHPVVQELPLAHAVAVVFHDDLILVDGHSTTGRVGVVGVLHQFGEGDVSLADQRLAELLEECRIGLELGGLFLRQSRHGRTA